MPIIQWTDALSVNVREIDGQHKHLVEMINSLFDAMKAGQAADKLGSILTGLVTYTKTHFAAEEKYMQQYQYPHYAMHKVEHDKLTAKVVDFGEKFKTGKATISIDLMNFLKDWLTKHIQQVDKQYSAFFNKKGLK